MTNLLKGGFIHFDTPASGPTVLAFQYNPEILHRILEPALAQPLAPPREVIQFQLSLDATDKLSTGDSTATNLGILPQLGVLELLSQPPAPGSLTVLVWSPSRILPVRVTALQITEQMFDPKLHPIRAEVAVTLLVLNSAELSSDPHAQKLWQTHLALLRQFAEIAASQSSLAQLGLTEIP